MATKLVSTDLKRWLPSTFLINEEVAGEMLKVATAQLHTGMQIIQDELEERDGNRPQIGERDHG